MSIHELIVDRINHACANVCSTMLGVELERMEVTTEMSTPETDLEQHLGPLGLSIPTVVFGRNFKTRSVGSAEWIIERFRWEDEDLIIKFTLAPSERTAHSRLHTFSQCTLDV